MQAHSIVPLEKKLFAFSVLFCFGMLAFIAFAAFRFGITVPGCVDGMTPFQKSSLIKKADEHYELHAVAKMWTFDPARIDVPTGTTLDIFVTSLDVNHGFHINGTNVNLTAVPGAINYARITFSHPGDYPIVCHEYCGVGHQSMFAVLHVTDNVLEPRIAGEETAAPNDSPILALGQKFYTEKGCVACHSLDDSKRIGPSFKGLYKSKVTLSDGSIIEANDDYLMESIRDPQKKIVKGYENIPMPKLPMTDEEVKALTEFIKSTR